MTHLPTAPPGPAPPAPPAPPPETRRRTAWSDGVARLRVAAHTEPGRLRIVGAALAGLLLLFGAVTIAQVADRTAVVGTVIDRSQPVSTDAASIYRSLADANTTAAAGFLAGGEEPAGVRRRYERDIETAAVLLAAAAAHSGGSEQAAKHIEVLSQGLPVYTGLVETARANNRQGLPLGGAYLRYADQQMQERLLPAAEALYDLETEHFQSDLDNARAWPWLAVGAGLLALAVLGWAQRRHYRRTNRVLNRGLVTATAATVVLQVWLVTAHAFARTALDDADRDAAQSLSVLYDGWTNALQARGHENMTLVARGAGDDFEEEYQKRMDELAGSRSLGRPPEAPFAGAESTGLLHSALDLANNEEGRRPLREALSSTEAWRERHATARELENAGDYDAAVARVIGAGDAYQGSTAETFDQVNDALGRAVTLEQEQFDQAAEGGRAALRGLVVGAVTCCVFGAAGALVGIGRRLSEYR